MRSTWMCLQFLNENDKKSMMVTAVSSYHVFVFVYLQKPDVQVKKFLQTVTKKFLI